MSLTPSEFDALEARLERGIRDLGIWMPRGARSLFGQILDAIRTLRAENERLKAEHAKAEKRAEAMLRRDVRDEDDYPVCGRPGWGLGMGCGERITDGLYRCAQCDVAFHGDCLRKHFNQEGRLTPTQQEYATLRAERLEAALSIAEDGLRRIIPPNGHRCGGTGCSPCRASATLTRIREAREEPAASALPTCPHCGARFGPFPGAGTGDAECRCIREAKEGRS